MLNLLIGLAGAWVTESWGKTTSSKSIGMASVKLMINYDFIGNFIKYAE